MEDCNAMHFCWTISPLHRHILILASAKEQPNWDFHKNLPIGCAECMSNGYSSLCLTSIESRPYHIKYQLQNFADLSILPCSIYYLQKAIYNTTVNPVSMAAGLFFFIIFGCFYEISLHRCWPVLFCPSAKLTWFTVFDNFLKVRLWMQWSLFWFWIPSRHSSLIHS